MKILPNVYKNEILTEESVGEAFVIPGVFERRSRILKAFSR